jgi:mono/diheme cytochrome c family protein
LEQRWYRTVCVLLLGGIATLVRTGAAQTPAPAAPRTTLSGVYSDSQAARGKNVYYGSCRSCHSTSEYTGARYRNLWEGHTLLDVFTYIREQMPSNEPGSLPPESVVDVIAYLLNINAMPVGKQELPVDTTQLKSIRVVGPPSDAKNESLGAGRGLRDHRRVGKPHHEPSSHNRPCPGYTRFAPCPRSWRQLSATTVACSSGAISGSVRSPVNAEPSSSTSDTLSSE